MLDILNYYYLNKNILKMANKDLNNGCTISNASCYKINDTQQIYILKSDCNFKLPHYKKIFDNVNQYFETNHNNSDFYLLYNYLKQNSDNPINQELIKEFDMMFKKDPKFDKVAFKKKIADYKGKILDDNANKGDLCVDYKKFKDNFFSLVFIGDYIDNDLQIKSNIAMVKGDNFRIYKYGGNFMICSHDLEYFYPLEIKEQSILIGQKTSFLDKNIIQDKCYIINELYDDFSGNFLYSFDKNGVIIQNFKNKEIQQDKINIIPYKKDKILSDGTGLKKIIDNTNDSLFKEISAYGASYGYLPKFEFSSNLADISVPNNKNYIKLGVGHIRIPNDFSFKDDSNINFFINMINISFPKMFGNLYNINNSLTNSLFCGGEKGLSFFYILRKLGDKYEMYISDAFLPINLVEGNNIYSLFCTHGIFIKNNNVHLTSGEGDEYANIISFNLEQVLKSCIHNINQFDVAKYNFNFLFYFNKKTYISNEIIFRPKNDDCIIISKKGNLNVTKSANSLIIKDFNEDLAKDPSNNIPIKKYKLTK